MDRQISTKIVKLKNIKDIKSSKKAVSPIDLFYTELKQSGLKLLEHLYEKDDDPFAIDVTKVYVCDEDYNHLRSAYEIWLKKVHKEPARIIELSLGMAELQFFPCRLTESKKNTLPELKENEVLVLDGWVERRKF